MKPCLDLIIYHKKGLETNLYKIHLNHKPDVYDNESHRFRSKETFVPFPQEASTKKKKVFTGIKTGLTLKE